MQIRKHQHAFFRLKQDRPVSKILKEKSSLFLSLPSLRMQRRRQSSLQARPSLMASDFWVLSIKISARNARSGIFGRYTGVRRDGPVTIILIKIDKKDQVDPWFFSSIIKSQIQSVFDKRKNLFSGFGSCDRKDGQPRWEDSWRKSRIRLKQRGRWSGYP